MEQQLNRYEVIIYWSKDDNSFIAEVPALPGCMSDGKSYTDAINNVQIIMAEWIDTAISLGRAIPGPKGKLIYA